MKILFTINTLGGAGAENALISMLRLMNDEKYDIDLYVIMSQGEVVKRLPEYVRLLNKDYKDVPVLSGEGKSHLIKKVLRSGLYKGNGIRNIPYIVKNGIALKKTGNLRPENLLWRMISDSSPVFDTEYDLAVAFLEGGATYYTADHVKAKKKIAFLHVDYTMAGYTPSLDRDAYSKYDKVFTVSDEVKESFVRVYPEYAEKIGVFHNILDTEDIKEKADNGTGFTDDYKGKRILTVGRLTPQKGYEVSIEAMKLLKKEGVEARWYVLGDGKLRSELQGLIDSYGLHEDFLLLGAKDNPYTYMKECDLYVHATRFEGKSIAIEEAQVLGCAVVASDRSGNREQIENGVDGILCEFTPEGIRDGILKAFHSDELRDSISEAAAKKQHGGKDELRKIFDLI